MSKFDETNTDRDFERGLKQADSEWMEALARREPDLAVEGLKGSFIATFLRLFTGRER